MKSRLALIAITAAMTLGVTVGLSALAASTAVSIKDFGFVPQQATITVGDSVIWTNNDPTQHTATSLTGAFDTGFLAPGQSRSFVFSEAGVFNYICSLHASMTGRITVLAAATPAPVPTASPVPPTAAPTAPPVQTPAPTAPTTPAPPLSLSPSPSPTPSPTASPTPSPTLPPATPTRAATPTATSVTNVSGAETGPGSALIAVAVALVAGLAVLATFLLRRT